MSHDQIRDYLDRIEQKVDAIATELGGDKNTMGIRTQLHELQEHRKNSQKIAWFLIVTTLGLAIKAVWTLISGKQ